MAETETEQRPPYDPFEPFRGMRDAYLEGLSKAMIEVVNTESYAQATGAMLDCYLTASTPFREALEKSMQQSMQQLSLPSRQEVANLAERFTNVEMRLDDIDAKLDSLVKEFASMRQTAANASGAPHSNQGATHQPRRNTSQGNGPRK